MWTTDSRNLGKMAMALAVVSIAAFAGCSSSNKTTTASNSAAPAPAPKASAPATQVASAKASAQQVKVINTVCPIGGDEFGSAPQEASLTRAYKGKEIGFCCSKCVAKFDKMSDSQKDDVLKRAMANAAQ